MVLGWLCPSRHQPLQKQQKPQRPSLWGSGLSLRREASLADFRFTSLTIPCPSAAREARIERFHSLVSTTGDGREAGLTTQKRPRGQRTVSTASVSPTLLAML